MWQEIQANSEYKGKDHHGGYARILGAISDGSTTKRLLQPSRRHRLNPEHVDDGAGRGRSISLRLLNGPYATVDLCATLGDLLGCPPMDSQGTRLKEFARLNRGVPGVGKGCEVTTQVQEKLPENFQEALDKGLC